MPDDIMKIPCAVARDLMSIEENAMPRRRGPSFKGISTNARTAPGYTPTRKSP